jgi:hypothetical protein
MSAKWHRAQELALRRLGQRRRTGCLDVHADPTAKLNDIDSQAWLADVLNRIADPARRLHELLPWKWHAQTAEQAAAA